MSPPPPPGRKQFYYCADGSTVEGPVSADDLFVMVTHGKVSGDAVVCEAGGDDWIPFTQLPDSMFSPQQVAQSLKLAEARQMEQAREVGKAIGASPLLSLIMGVFLFVLMVMAMKGCQSFAQSNGEQAGAADGRYAGCLLVSRFAHVSHRLKSCHGHRPPADPERSADTYSVLASS